MRKKQRGLHPMEEVKRRELAIVVMAKKSLVALNLKTDSMEPFDVLAGRAEAPFISGRKLALGAALLSLRVSPGNEFLTETFWN